MIVVRVKPTHPFFEAIALLTRISTQADVKFTPEGFSITVSQHFPRFKAVLQMATEFFSSFLVTQNLNARISLDSFYIVMEATRSPAITINLLEQKFSLLLRFENSKNQPKWREELKLWPSEEENVGYIDFQNCVSIDSNDFRRIVQEDLSVSYQDTICVTLMNSQLRFSIGTKESILTKEGGKYIVINHQEGVDIEFKFILHPISFFDGLTDRPAGRVWFFKTTDAQSIISVPFALFAGFLMYFP